MEYLAAAHTHTHTHLLCMQRIMSNLIDFRVILFILHTIMYDTHVELCIEHYNKTSTSNWKTAQKYH